LLVAGMEGFSKDQLYISTVKRVGEKFCLINSPDERDNTDVFVSIQRVLGGSSSVLSEGDTVSFSIHLNARGQRQCSAPLWRMMGRPSRGESPAIGEYVGKVRKLFDNGSSFVECPDVKQEHGHDCYIHHSTMNMCGLQEGDHVSFNVHISQSGKPQMSGPCWLCVSPETWIDKAGGSQEQWHDGEEEWSLADAKRSGLNDKQWGRGESNQSGKAHNNQWPRESDKNYSGTTRVARAPQQSREDSTAPPPPWRRNRSRTPPAKTQRPPTPPPANRTRPGSARDWPQEETRSMGARGWPREESQTKGARDWPREESRSTPARHWSHDESRSMGAKGRPQEENLSRVRKSSVPDYSIGTVKRVNVEKDFSLFECPESGHRDDIYVPKHIVSPEWLAEGDLVLFDFHINDKGKPHVSAPVWKMVGRREQNDQTIGILDFQGVLRRNVNGNGFVECSEVKDKFGADVFVHGNIMAACDLELDDTLRFNIHVSAAGKPQLSAPCWKCFEKA